MMGNISSTRLAAPADEILPISFAEQCIHTGGEGFPSSMSCRMPALGGGSQAMRGFLPQSSTPAACFTRQPCPCAQGHQALAQMGRARGGARKRGLEPGDGAPAPAQQPPQQRMRRTPGAVEVAHQVWGYGVMLRHRATWHLPQQRMPRTLVARVVRMLGFPTP